MADVLLPPLLSAIVGRYDRDLDTCGMDYVRLCWIEESIRSGEQPHNARVLLRDELQGFYDDEYKRRKSLRPTVFVLMSVTPRDGMDVREKNRFYSPTSHKTLAEDRVRVQAYRKAIRHAMQSWPGARVLDVGSGPYLLLGRMASAAGASFVACVEHSTESVRMATQIMRAECLAFDWRCRIDEPPDVNDGSTLDSGGGGGGGGGEPGREGSAERRAKIAAWNAKRDAEHVVSCCLELLGELSVGLRPSAIRISSGGGAEPLMRVTSSAAAATTLGGLTASAGSHQPDACCTPAAAAPGECVVELFHGLASEVVLPCGFDLIVHEILGNIASAEGAIKAVNELRGREGLGSKGLRILPAAAGTMIAPTSVLEPNLIERLLMYERTGRSHAQARHMYSVRGFPASNFLAPPQPMEWLDFNGELPSVCRTTRVFTSEHACRFDGLHMHLVAHLDETTAIDAYAERTSWTCTYVRLLDEDDALWLPAGARVECTIDVDASTDLPTYAIQVRVAGDARSPFSHVTDFSWRGDG